MYNGYIQPRVHYGITSHDCSMQKNIDIGLKVTNPCSEVGNGYFGCINCRRWTLLNNRIYIQSGAEGLYFFIFVDA